MKRTVFFISDGTGITAETLGHSLLTQFEQIQFEQITRPYIDTQAKAQQLIQEINHTMQKDGNKPIIFSTLINSEIRQLVASAQGIFFDFFQTFLNPLESELKTPSSHSVGRSHGIVDYNSYKTRIDAVNYALSCDDGISTQNYSKADIILVGVSRCGKTPTCLYLALQFGIFAANYPFTEEDMMEIKLPTSLQPYRSQLFGLTIDPNRLQAIRSERRANSKYAEIKQCQVEVQTVEKLYLKEKIPYLSTTTRSIEEIATTILALTGIKRRLF